MKIRDIIVGLMSITAVAALNGCSDEPVNGNENYGTRNLAMRFEVKDDMPETRAVDAKPAEMLVQQIHLLFFDERTERFKAYMSVPIDNPAERSFRFNVPAGIDDSRKWKVLAVANGDRYADAGDFSSYLGTFTTDDTYQDMVMELQAKGTKMTNVNPGVLPMFGTLESDDGSGEVPLVLTRKGETAYEVRDIDKIHIMFSRAVCRFDLRNMVGDILHIEYVRVVNERDAGLLFMDGAPCGTIPAYQEVTDPAAEGCGYVPVTEGTERGSRQQRLEASLYGFPNSVAVTSIGDHVTTALMIAGYYKDETKLTYYRFNMADLGAPQNLMRNYCYQGTITGVKERGKDTEKEAYEATRPVFEYQVEEKWDVTDDNVVTDDAGHFLILSQTHLTFPGIVEGTEGLQVKTATNPDMHVEFEWVRRKGAANEDRFSYAGEARSDNPETEKDESRYPNIFTYNARFNNESDVYYYGFLRAHAVDDETGERVLTLPIYLTQLSTQVDAQVLTVDDKTGEFSVEGNPQGGILKLKVCTGRPDVKWEAKEIGDNQWLTQLEKSRNENLYSKGGYHNGYLEIKLPANTDADRETKIEVSRRQKTGEDEVEVPPVTVIVKQAKSKQLLKIINAPADGKIRINCLSDEVTNSNGIVHPMKFIVKLADPTKYNVRIRSTFDYSRDLVLSFYDHSPLASAESEWKSSQAGDYENGQTWVPRLMDLSGQYPSVQFPNDKIKTNHGYNTWFMEFYNLGDGTEFWINPFRMCPGDPVITGRVSVEMYAVEGTQETVEERGFTVELYADDSDWAQGDVLISNGDGTYALIADRSLGQPARNQYGHNGVTEAKYYTNMTNYRITGLSDDAQPQRQTEWAPTVINASVPQWSAQTFTPTIEQCMAQWNKDNEASDNWFYKNECWEALDAKKAKGLQGKVCQAKNRAYVVSDFRDRNGKIVFCWLPYNDSNNRHTSSAWAIDSYGDKTCGFPMLYVAGSETGKLRGFTAQGDDLYWNASKQRGVYSYGVFGFYDELVKYNSSNTQYGAKSCMTKIQFRPIVYIEGSDATRIERLKKEYGYDISAPRKSARVKRRT